MRLFAWQPQPSSIPHAEFILNDDEIQQLQFDASEEEKIPTTPSRALQKTQPSATAIKAVYAARSGVR